jgi:hypothetical protein
MLKKCSLILVISIFSLSSSYALTDDELKMLEAQREAIKLVEEYPESDTYKWLQESIENYEADLAIDAVEAENETIFKKSDELVSENKVKQKLEEDFQKTVEELDVATTTHAEALEELLKDPSNLELQSDVKQAKLDLINAQAEKNIAEAEKNWEANYSEEYDKNEIEIAKEQADEARDNVCKESWNCIDKASFIINVNDVSPWMEVTPGNNTKQNVNKALWTIIQSLMVALWSLALLIMTVGAGYMIMHSGRDELLSKWKAIFMSWVYALLVALSSYYLIAIIRYILYK